MQSSMQERSDFLDRHDDRQSAAHTAPIYVNILGMPDIDGPKRHASDWVDLLDAFDSRLDPGAIEEIPLKLGKLRLVPVHHP